MYRHFLFNWTRFVARHAVGVLVILALITLAAGYLAITQFEINSDTNRLIQQETDWRKRQDNFLETFPQYNDLTFVVISGPEMMAVNEVSRELERHLLDNAEYFNSVYAPANSVFIDRHSLLFLPPDKLDEVISNLADAQPVLGAVARDPNLRGLLGLLNNALDGERELPANMTRLTDLLADAAEQLIAGITTPISWRDEFMTHTQDEPFYNVIFVRGKKNFDDRLPAATVIGAIESAIAQVKHPRRDEVDIRLTGQVPLDHAEITSAMESAQFAGAIALVVLVIVLVFGVRSLRVIVATYLSMLVGLIWTAAYALVSVGEFNTISIIFLVMFIGLGVDFAIHYCLRYQETLSSYPKELALIHTSADIGPAITLCAITSAIGFLSFVPTNYTGLAELGIISGGGMIIALILSFTIIPAFFALVREPVRLEPNAWIARVSTSVNRHKYTIVGAVVILTLGSVAIARHAYFDYSTLALKDPQSPAMQTFRELQQENIITDYSMRYIAPNMATAQDVKSSLLSLETVADVRTPLDYLPDRQEEKLSLLEDARFMLTPMFMSATDSTISDHQRLESVQQLAQSIGTWLQSNPGNTPLANSLRRLRQPLQQMIIRDDNKRLVKEYETIVVDPLLKELDWLELAIEVDRVDFQDLPQGSRERLVTPDDRVLISIIPAEDLVSVQALERFATEVTGVIEEATGRPLVELGIGEIVIDALTRALALAVIAIAIILLITLRNPVDAILVFIPLMLAAVMTLATSVVAGLPLNMANVVVIPLIFGLGVDNGIHVVKRYRESPNIAHLAGSSTPRAVFLSTLTTLSTFGALSFSSHQGIFSIGILLSCALSFLLILTLFALPALLAVFSPKTPQP